MVTSTSRRQAFLERREGLKMIVILPSEISYLLNTNSIVDTSTESSLIMPASKDGGANGDSAKHAVNIHSTIGCDIARSIPERISESYSATNMGSRNVTGQQLTWKRHKKLPSESSLITWNCRLAVPAKATEPFLPIAAPCRRSASSPLSSSCRYSAYAVHRQNNNEYDMWYRPPKWIAYACVCVRFLKVADVDRQRGMLR